MYMYKSGVCVYRHKILVCFLSLPQLECKLHEDIDFFCSFLNTENSYQRLVGDQ